MLHRSVGRETLMVLCTAIGERKEKKEKIPRHSSNDRVAKIVITCMFLVSISCQQKNEKFVIISFHSWRMFTLNV